MASAKNIEKLGEILTLNKGVYEDEFGYIAIERRFCESACEESLNLLNDIYQTTGFGASFFLRGRRPSEIVVTIEHKNNGITFSVIPPDQDLEPA